MLLHPSDSQNTPCNVMPPRHNIREKNGVAARRALEAVVLPAVRLVHAFTTARAVDGATHEIEKTVLVE